MSFLLFSYFSQIPAQAGPLTGKCCIYYYKGSSGLKARGKWLIAGRRLYILANLHYNKKCVDALGRAEKRGERMTEKELITSTIDRYTELQQIKRANGGHENELLDYFIRVTAVKLSSMGVNVEDITLK